MLVPLSWLCDFAPFPFRASDDPSALTSTLDDLGLVVEGVRQVGVGLDDVVVARVLHISAIPGADRIRQVTVDAGAGRGTVGVVCGAWNFATGDLVPLAPVGAVLPGNFEIRRRRMKGVESEGMLCSGSELGLGGDHAGIMVLDAGGGGELEPGVPLTEALGIQPDVVLDLAVEANRPDAMSIAGVARDLAARLGLPFAIPQPAVEASGPSTAGLATAVVHAPDLCPRFTVRALTDVRVGPSPAWLARRLELAGMRSLNNVVDASNYVMLELGQPNHPYDLDRLGGRGLSVRAARRGEVLVTLDGQERQLGGGPFPDCLICDAEDLPVGIGGIMGGASAEITDATRTVLLEAAYFTPMAIARTSKRLGLRTEASARFERGCDPQGIERAVARFCQLLAETGAVGAASPDLIDCGGPPAPRAQVRVRTARANAVLGTSLDDDTIRGYLEPLGLRADPVEPGVLDVSPPGFRPDVVAEIDVIEEVARHHGYSRVARTVPAITQVGALTRQQRDRRRLRDALAGDGCNEAFPLSLLGPGDHERAGLPSDAVELANPLAREESVLRTSQRPGLLRAVAHNVRHRTPDVRLFEIGHVFFPRPASVGAALPEEREVLAVILAGAGADAEAAARVWEVAETALRIDGVGVEGGAAPGMHPTRTARLVGATGEELGLVGEVDPAVVAAYDLSGRVGWLEVDLGLLWQQPRRSARARSVSRFPSSDVDLAFVVTDGVPAAAVEATLRAAAGELLIDAWLFDVFRGGHLGDGARSLAYRIRFGAMDRTLTDAEVATARERCIDAVTTAHGAVLRG